MLIASRVLTISVARASNGKKVRLPRTFNPYTGKPSRQTAFSDAGWGKPTRAYASSISKLPQQKFNSIMDEAQEYITFKLDTNKEAEVIEINDDDDREGLYSDGG
jgi:hypothetical protein